MKKISLKLSLIAIVTIAGLLTFSSCSKTDANASFVGTYTGNTVTGGISSPDTVVVTAGTAANAVILLERKNGVSLNGTVSGSTLTIPSQNATISGASLPFSGYGGLSGNTLTVNSTETYNGTPINSVFTGSK
jgi:hypothetical protein